jgi:hypothetical protein
MASSEENCNIDVQYSPRDSHQNVPSRNDPSQNDPSHSVPSQKDPVTKGTRSRNDPDHAIFYSKKF